METGLVEVCSPANPAIDVIFIHGIDGDPESTWTADGPDTFWPRWLGEDIPSAAVWSIGYNAWSSKWRGRSMRLPERAVNLMAYLESRGIGERPMCFVCHSMGGLVAKQIMFHDALFSNGRDRNFSSATRGIVFLGTPHTGASLAKTADVLRAVYRPTAAMRDLEVNDAYLRQLNDWYRDFASQLDLRHLVMYETKAVKGLRIVDSTSSNPGLLGVTPIPVDADHISLCKPAARSSLVYTSTLKFVRQLVLGIEGGGLSMATHTARTSESTTQESSSAAVPTTDVQAGALPQSSRQKPDERLVRAVQQCVQQLLVLQFPWGEWSDRRTDLESMIAERNPRAYAAVPKPNVARTLFALEALGNFENPEVVEIRERALHWMISNVTDGWMREWAEGQTPHSETRVPELVLRADIRHTAQLITAMCKWHHSRDPLASMVRNLSVSALADGFWPNNVGGRTPRLLATVYAVEALANVIMGVFRLDVSDMLDRPDEALARKALRQGISALISDCQEGQGLLGSSTSVGSPYTTGLALFRIGQLAGRHPDLLQLTQVMINGLSDTVSSYGWEDSSTPAALRAITRSRTTLRCAGGIIRAAHAGADVSEAFLARCIEMITSNLLSDGGSQLDSPDYACGLTSLLLVRPDLKSNDLWSEAYERSVHLRSALLPVWRDELQIVVSRIRSMMELNMPGYREALDIYETRLTALNAPD